MVAPSFVVTSKDGIVLVTFERQTKSDEAVVIWDRNGASGQNVAVLVVKSSTASSTRTVMLRPIAPGQLRYELYVEFPGAGSSRNFYYTEVFKKAK